MAFASQNLELSDEGQMALYYANLMEQNNGQK